MNAAISTKKQVYHSCASCARETWHEVLFSHLDSEEEYHVDTIHQVVRCCGCRRASYRKVERDIEAAYPINDTEWHVPEEISCFPSILKGYREFEDVWELPKMVRDVYTQSIRAIKEGSNILAGIGLRATIEAICNDRSIAGSRLDKRIDALSKGGLISQKDAERLHAIRFLGNDAAHEIRNSNPKNLLIAVRIIEHLLVNIYILDHEADGKLETIIRTPETFLSLLEVKLSGCISGEEVPLAKIFRKDMRRFHGYFREHEKHLIDQISSAVYTKLAIGKLDVYAGSKEKLQHFILQ